MADSAKSGRIATDTRASKRGFEVWGLTGGIAAGKSSAARLLEEAGIPVIDADQISRELSRAGGAAHPAILQRFGTADRLKLRNIVFGDEKARRDLEAILHPLIQAESMRRMNELSKKRARPGPFIYEAALLVETGRYRELDGLIVVEAPREQRIARLCSRDGITRALAERMLDAQLPEESRRAAATEIIVNSGDESELRAAVEALLRRRGWK